MKRLLLVLFCIVYIFSFSACSVSSAADVKPLAHSRYTVVIDAGHGGKDAGTIGVDGTEEKGINLSVALILYDYLMVSGIDCKLVRDKDYELYYTEEDKQKSDLYNRLDYVNAVKNSALISIHQNHYESPKEWGCQVWYSKNNDESKVLADKILTSVKAFIQPENTRQNKESGSEYYILYNATVPSVMVECGFMSNPEENKLLQNTDYQKKFAYAILAGICGEV
ncbi:MAG: N-acetylmuramoyl-L-alanine amidase [Eubacterium sp.]|nr:N-acetylmuramoyl-L-alanine amidase [Eubacterium sp.]MBR0412185.1 N-acetylmuramoyl-L-alanine amidase [Eubacterium sp.]